MYQLRLCGLYCKNRYEWVVTEQACNAYGGVVVPLYDTLGEQAVTYILNQTAMRTVFCGRAETKMLLAAKEHHSTLTGFKNIVQFEDVTEAERKTAHEQGLNLLSFAEVIASGKASPQDVTPPAVDDVATFCYTSGTTGDPKGVMLTHQNIVADTTGAIIAGVLLNSDDRHLSYLPLAHMFERLVQVTCWMSGAAVGFYQGSPLKIMEDLKALRPTLFPSVPRLYNKIYDKITNGVTAAGGLKATLFNKGLASKTYYLKNGGHLTHGFYDKLIFNKVRAKLGLDRCNIMVTGSAPISAHVMDFLRVVFCCHVVEGYGQTETAAGATITPLAEQAEGGHVGVPIACNEIRLVDVPDMGYLVTDKTHGEGKAAIPCNGRGEIWYRGPNVFRGYYKNATKTAEAMEGDWLKSGDIGIWLPRGFLKIVDRKKNIFKLSQGEYIAAEKIENIYIGSPFIAQAFVYGDSLQSCLVAIIVPDVDYVMPWAKSKGIAGKDLAEVCAQKATKDAIMADMQTHAKAAKLHSFENAKAIHLESELWSVENEMLTPTFKLKRNQGKKKYQATIDALYASLGSRGVVAGKAGLKQGHA